MKETVEKARAAAPLAEELTLALPAWLPREEEKCLPGVAPRTVLFAEARILLLAAIHTVP